MSRPGADTMTVGYRGAGFDAAKHFVQFCPDRRVSFVSAVGTDAMSDRALHWMTDHGIDTSHILRKPDGTIGVRVAAGADHPPTEWHKGTAAQALAQNGRRLARAFEGASLIYVTAATLAILPPQDRQRLIDGLQAARKWGSVVVFATHGRAALWASGNEMRQVIGRASAASDVVFADVAVEQAVFGDSTPESILARYMAGRDGGVMVTNGTAGVTCGSSKRIDCQNLGVGPDLSAAGEAFHAGVLSGMLQGYLCEDAVNNAIAALFPTRLSATG